jgi:hypothetical protein
MHGPPCIFWANLTPFSLKTTHIDTDGSLRLVYWKGNDALKGIERTPAAGDKRSAGGLNGTLGFVVEVRKRQEMLSFPIGLMTRWTAVS